MNAWAHCSSSQPLSESEVRKPQESHLQEREETDRATSIWLLGPWSELESCMEELPLTRHSQISILGLHLLGFPRQGHAQGMVLRQILKPQITFSARQQTGVAR